MSYLSSINNPRSVITAIPSGMWFPESLDRAKEKYGADILAFAELVRVARSSIELLDRIRSKSIPAARRMSLLKAYRRCVSLVADTETTKGQLTVPASEIMGHFPDAVFKPIDRLKEQFASPSEELISTLAALLAENDFRGEPGYGLTEQFFDWFEDVYRDLEIIGPRRAGPDVELTTIFPDFDEASYPCDFVIRVKSNGPVLAIGFARYDSTRGGSQSDDRTGGNSNKVDRAQRFAEKSGRRFRMIFVADGPGLVHRDTWHEACDLDDSWDGNVRVTTLKLAPERLDRIWLNQVLPAAG